MSNSRVLYEYETWYLTLREEHRFKVSENELLGAMFGSGAGKK
jgi:hypothetical protein